MDKDLSNHGAMAYDTSLKGMTRDLPDTDLSDHGATAYDSSQRVVSRDLVDADLSDHGAIAYDSSQRVVSRDLVDADLSDHGAIAYASKEETWGTNNENIIKEINTLMRASFYKDLDQIVPQLNAGSLAKVVDYRYRQVANVIDDSRYGLSKDAKEKIGTNMCLDFLLIGKAIATNPNCLEDIFSPSLYVGSNDKTNIFGVLDKYQQDLTKANTPIPLIYGATGEVVKDADGNEIDAQRILNQLMAKKEMMMNPTTGSRNL